MEGCLCGDVLAVGMDLATYSTFLNFLLCQWPSSKWLGDLSHWLWAADCLFFHCGWSLVPKWGRGSEPSDLALAIASSQALPLWKEGWWHNTKSVWIGALVTGSDVWCIAYQETGLYCWCGGFKYVAGGVICGYSFVVILKNSEFLLETFSQRNNKFRFFHDLTRKG